MIKYLEYLDFFFFLADNLKYKLQLYEHLKAKGFQW